MIGTTEQELLYDDHVDFDAVSVPMRGGSLAMLLVLPDPALAVVGPDVVVLVVGGELGALALSSVQTGLMSSQGAHS